MSDDIDIEEHDVLDNPRIRHMFPQIISIKTEIEDYEEADTSINIEGDFNTYHNSNQIILKEENSPKLFNNKIIIGSKPCNSTAQVQVTRCLGIESQGARDPETGSEKASSKELVKEPSDQDFQESSILSILLEDRQFPNKIIIGSKAHSTNDSVQNDSMDEEYELPDVSVVLEDCRNFLANNPTFCKECEILFATHNDLDAHKMLAHSFLVAVNKNKAIKSTSKGHQYNTLDKSLLCNHCNVVFPNTITLLKHTYELLPRKFSCVKCELVFESDAACKTHKAVHKCNSLSSPSTKYLICKICSCHFKTMFRLKMHMKTNHHTETVENIQHVVSNFQCHFCSTKTISSKHYNVHVWKCHPKLYSAFHADSENSKFQCPQCNSCFPSEYSVRIHLAAKHGYIGNVEDSKKLANFRKTQKSNNSTLSKLPAKSQNKTRNITRTRPLPKSTLFKCNKCHLHFVSCVSAVIHSTSCSLNSKTAGSYKCQLCRRFFKLQDKFYHNCQHDMADKFKVIEVTRNILSRILSKCKTCEICFDEKSFMTFHADTCSAHTPSAQCKECNVWIHTRAMGLHKKNHTSGLTTRDFIITEYVHVSRDIGYQEKPKFRGKHVKKGKVFVNKRSKLAVTRRADKKAYYYCPTCKCYMKVNRFRDKHYIGECETSEDKLQTCKSCGLRFSRKSYQSHQQIHQMFPKLKLKDLTFTNIQNGAEVDPPFPDFKKCYKCKVSFFSIGALNHHVCYEEESKICKFCDEKFSDLAYKLHVPYHEYSRNVYIDKVNDMPKTNENIPELIKKYESLQEVWNILYLCQSCDVVMDTYDKVVEHCQDHFCNMQSYNVTIEHCAICDLNFVNDCFERHVKLHLNDDMDKESFIILTYKYENLLKASWTDLFKSLTKEQIQLILAKSMYKFTRCVRMKLVSKGLEDMTLYQCGTCKAIVAPNKVVEHSQNMNGNCKSRKRLGCTICNFKFAYNSNKIVHDNLHEIRNLNAKSFRIVQFHVDKQISRFEVKGEVGKIDNNEKAKDPHGLKFIRCQSCGKLINKQKYKIHTQNHINYNKYNSKVKSVEPIQPNYKNIKTKNQIKNTNKVFNFYVCKECKICVAREGIKTHICDENVKKKKCPKCSLFFRAQNLASHYKTHANKIPNRSHMQVMYFEGDVIYKNSKSTRSPLETKTPNQDVMIWYQCTYCNSCLWQKRNISKHVCASKDSQYTCEICGLVFLKLKRSIHTRLHETKQFNRGNIQLFKFNNRKPGEPKIVSAHKVPTSYDDTSAGKPIYKRKLVANYEGTPAKKSKVENLQSISNITKHSMHNIHYKCKICKLLFVNLVGLILHERKCYTDRYAIRCGDCGLIFHTSVISKHKTINCKNLTEDRVYILTIKQLGDTYQNMSNWILQCNRCDVYNNSLGGLQYHLKMNHQWKYVIKSCVQCNIRMTAMSYINHVKIHHEEEDKDISEISIATVEDTTLAGALEDIPNTEHIKLQSDIHTCSTCALNFLNVTSLYKHNYRGLHNVKKYSCKVCGLKFTHESLKKHMKMHHKYGEIEQNDGEMSYTDVNDSVIESISSIFDENQSKTLSNGEEVYNYDSSESSIDLPDNDNDKDVDPLQSVSNYDESPSENSINDVINSKTHTTSANVSNAPAKNMINIYKCHECGLNFVHPNSLQRHTQIGKHNEVKHKCKECGLLFSRITLKKHMEMHHKVKNYKRKHTPHKKLPKIDTEDSFGESISRIFDIQPSSIDTKNIDNSDRTNSNNSFLKNNTNTSGRDNIGYTSNPKSNIATKRTIDNENNTVTELNKNKLFKCSVCNVYFITSEDCLEHTTNHVQLDTFEYIACKICDLQFCCEFLGRHMKSHREKTFSTDDLIIAEYYPSSGEAKKDTYLFVDRLKTKLVSTTFDTEPVDSTTTENAMI